MSDTFLDNDELQEITEFKYRKKQHQQLVKMGVPFKITKSGKPLVSRVIFNELMGAKKVTPTEVINLEALRSISNGQKTKV